MLTKTRSNAGRLRPSTFIGLMLVFFLWAFAGCALVYTSAAADKDATIAALTTENAALRSALSTATAERDAAQDDARASAVEAARYRALLKRYRAKVRWRTATASWYGPGFYGNATASGATLTRGMRNAAHKTLPFGTRIAFRYRGRTVTAVVNDRGPFVAGREFDLGPGTAAALGFTGVGTVEWRRL